MNVSATPAATSPPTAAGVHTQGRWFGDEARPGFGWLSSAHPGQVASGVVIAPPLGYPYWGSHRTLRVLAERLARRGHAVLRIDYDGTGDSAGDQWDPDRVGAWRNTVREAARELRRLGARELTLVGVRIGATLMLLEAEALDADAVVAWLPIETGRRYAKELRLLSTPVPEQADPLHPPGTLTFAGSVFSSQTLQDLRGIAVANLTAPPARATLVIDDPGGSCAGTVKHLRSLQAGVEHLRLAGGEQALEVAAEHATVPEQIVAAACQWIGDAPETDTPPARAAPSPTADPWRTARLQWRGGHVREAVITLAPRGHVAIISSPDAGDPQGATLVLLNPGSETHVGPGRAWVEIARDLALAGRRTVRVDFVGWGESPDRGHAPGRPYDAHCVPDTLGIVQELRAAGHDRVVCFGLCASAWIVLEAVRAGTMDGAIALNPQLYWKPGDDVEIDWDLIRRTRSEEIRRVELGARLGLWSLLDAVGHRSRAGRWLDAVAATGVPTHLLFAPGDDGLKYIRERLGRRLDRLTGAGGLSLAEVGEIDHPLHRTWVRGRVVSAILGALTEIDGDTASGLSARRRSRLGP